MGSVSNHGMGSSKSVSKERHVTGRDCHPSGVRKVLPISGERTHIGPNLGLPFTDHDAVEQITQLPPLGAADSLVASTQREPIAVVYHPYEVPLDRLGGPST